MKNLGCFLVLLLFSFTTSAHASDLTLFGGMHRPGKLSLQRVGQAGPGLTDPANFGVFGIRYTHGRFSESTFAYSPNFIEGQTKAILLNSNLILHVPLPKVRPYGTVGLGSVITKGDGLADVGAKFALNYGGGVKANIAGPLGARIDARGYAIPSFGREGLTIQDQTLYLFEVTIGLMFSW